MERSLQGKVMAEHGFGVVELVVISGRAELHVEGGSAIDKRGKGRDGRHSICKRHMVVVSSLELAYRDGRRPL